MEDQTTDIRSHPIRARPIQNQERQAALLDVAKERALEPDIFDEHPPFFWEAEFSNDLLDSHFTHMNEKTLNNYAADAQAGIAFLRAHNWRELPIGHSLTGRTEMHEGRLRVLSDFFTITGLADSDDLIWRMKSSIVRDVSVGFHGGDEWCDICRAKYWSWDCPHIAGLSYEVKDKGVVVATVEIDDAHASEVSGVFDGSTPNAEITKARRLAEAGELTGEQVGILEARYRISLPNATKQFRGVDVEKGNTMTAEEQLQAAQEELRKAGVTPAKTLDESVRVLLAQVSDSGKREQELQEQVAELEPQAADGRQYRADLVSDALAEGVRAQGADFDQETYRTVLEAAPLATIKRMRDDWQKAADARLPAGRQSQDGGEEPASKTRKLVPDQAYA